MSAWKLHVTDIKQCVAAFRFSIMFDYCYQYGLNMKITDINFDTFVEIE